MTNPKFLKSIEDELKSCFAASSLNYFKVEGNCDFLKVIKKNEQLGIKNGSHVLDVGTEYGILPALLSKKGFKVKATDIRDYLKGCGKDGFYKKHNIEFFLADATKDNFPFEDNTFDLVISMNAIEYFKNTLKHFLEEINRVLKKGGYFILTTPNWARIENRIINLFKSNYPLKIEAFWREDFDGHVREYTSKEIVQILT